MVSWNSDLVALTPAVGLPTVSVPCSHRDTAPPASGLPVSSVCGVLQHHLVLIVPHRLGCSLRASLQLFFMDQEKAKGFSS